MSVTYVNKKKLPAPLADAITFSDFTPAGTLSVPKMIDAPQIAYLKRHHKLEDDVSDKVWTLINKSLVQVIENGDTGHRARRAFSNVISALVGIQNTERASEAEDKKNDEWLNQLGFIISDLDEIVTEYFPPTDRYLVRQSYGVEFTETVTAFKKTDKEFTSEMKVTIFDTIPLYDKETKTLYYTRICNTFHATKPDLRQAWVRESNVHAYILQQNGHPVEHIVAVMIFKDWSAGSAENRKDYPKSQLETMALPLHPSAMNEDFIRVRIRQHLRAEMGDVAKCSASDRWAESDSYVVLRPGQKRPLKRAVNRDDAATWLAMNRHKMNDAYVDIDPGKSRRCEGYCPVREMCPQWLKERSARLQKDGEEKE